LGMARSFEILHSGLALGLRLGRKAGA
jgi:hypothetical protein